MGSVVFSQQNTAKKSVVKKQQIEKVAQQIVDKLDKRVSLTPDQKTKVLGLRKGYFQKRATIKAQYPDDMVKRVEEYKKIDVVYEAELNKVLTVTQQTKRKQKPTTKTK